MGILKTTLLTNGVGYSVVRGIEVVGDDVCGTKVDGSPPVCGTAFEGGRVCGSSVEGGIVC